MTVSDKDDILPVRRPSVFDGGVRAGFSTRHGGLSRGVYSSMNLGLSVGDDEAAVRLNRDSLLRSFGRSSSHLAVAGQIHGTHVAVADGSGLYRDTDGLVSGKAGLVLAITVADCAVVLLADETARVVAACHAGWRGAAGGICSSALMRMVSIGAETRRIRAYISPCISTAAFEVGEEVAQRFDDRFVVRRKEWPRPHVDLKSALRHELVTGGVSQNLIETSPECTVDGTDFFSHRSSGGRTGRMMGFIMLKSDEE